MTVVTSGVPFQLTVTGEVKFEPVDGQQEGSITGMKRRRGQAADDWLRRVDGEGEAGGGSARGNDCNVDWPWASEQADGNGGRQVVWN
jgi:hypothetical protein